MMVFFAMGLVLSWALFLAIVLLFNPKIKKTPANINRPFVSIIIAIRNEEYHIKELCSSLSQLTYSKSNYEILLGDDESEDDTFALLEEFKPENAKVFSLRKTDGSFGKQKVLIELANKAQGDFLLFSDADMQFNPDWIQGMLSGTSGAHEIAVGFTRVTGSDWFSRMQNIDWLFNEWVIGWFARVGVGLTAWGNNLMVSKSTYREVGGYESIEQSIVEDVALFRAIKAIKGRLVVNYNSSAVASTEPVTFYNLLQQRKRWMKGLSGLNPLFVLGGIVKWLFWPTLLWLAFDNVNWMVVGLFVFAIKAVIMSRVNRLTNSPHSLVFLLLFEVYDFVFYLLTFAFYLLPVKLEWKGRIYR